nr:MAG: hypothetical protein EDM05_26465 [Leptolyngbya sp. IPPAS B-1204]
MVHRSAAASQTFVKLKLSFNPPRIDDFLKIVTFVHEAVTCFEAYRGFIDFPNVALEYWLNLINECILRNKMAVFY